MLEAASHRRTGALRFPRAFRSATALFVALVLPFIAHAIIGTEYQMLLGNPSGATTDAGNHVNYLSQRAQFAMGYNDDRRVPNWVSWNLTTGDVGGSGRSSFITDTTLPAGFTVISTSAYSGSGYDRGHMCPSADRTIDTANNQQVFVMTNMVPQAPDNNQGVWANFETYCRTVASQGNELLITCGGSFYSGTTIGTYNVAVPGYVWKVVVVVPLGAGGALDRINANTRVITIKIPNVNGIRNDPWQNYLTSPAQIEADTGYTFFTALSPALRATLRTKVDGQTGGGPVIVTQPASQTVAINTPASFSVTATGTGTLTYQWYKNGVSIGGATASTLAIGSAQPADIADYHVVVTDDLGSTASIVVELNLLGAPQITDQPDPQEVLPGTPANFSVTATGDAPLTYQWYKDGIVIPGATNPTFAIGSVQAADLGVYDVEVSNVVGTVLSAEAELSFAVAPTITTQPAPQNAFVGSTATFSVVASGTAPLAYQWYKDANPIGGATAASYAIPNAQLTDAGNFSVVVTNLAGFATSNTVALTVSEPPPTSNIYWDFATAAPTSGLPPTLTGGTLSQGNSNGSPALIQTNSNSSGYTGASGGNNATIAARIGAYNPGASGSAYFEFTFTPTAGRKFVATGLKFGSRSTSTGPQAWAVYTSLDGYVAPIAAGAIPNNSTWALYAPTIPTLTGTIDAPVTFRIFGFNGTGSPSAGTANWRIDDLTLTAGSVLPVVAPSITTHPLTQDVFTDGSVTLTVAADGTAPFTYQWRKGGQDLAGQTGAALTLDPVTFATAGSYDVVVTNSAGSATSNAAVLTVYETFGTWAAHAGLTPPNDAATADPDGDGANNLLEYALGRSPTSFDATPLPTLTIEGGQAVFRYTKPKWISGLTYVVEGSTELATWTPATVTLESSTATTETFIATWPLDQAKRFAHLVVTKN